MRKIELVISAEHLKYSRVGRRAFQSMMIKESERISLYSILMGNIMPYLIPARIKEVPLVKAF